MPNLNMPGEEGTRPPVQPMMPGKDTGGLVKRLAIIIGVVVILGGGFFLYKSGMLPFGKKKSTPLPPPAEVVPLPAETTPTPAPTAATPTPEKKPPTGLKPAAAPTLMKPMGKGEFTVVIHSFPSRKVAEEAVARWSNAGFPAMVSEKKVGGSMWYRVSIGRYETRQMAKKAGKEMEHMLETGYWVDRVQ